MRQKAVVFLMIVAILIGILITAVSSEDWFLTAFTLGVYGLLLLLFHRLYNLLNWIDPTVLFVVYYATFIGIGIVATDYYDLVLTPGVSVAAVVGLAAFLVGAVASDMLASPPGRIKIRRSVSVVSTYRPGEIAWARVFLLVGALILLYYYYRVDTIPLLAEDAENVRVTVKAGQGYLPIVAYAFLVTGTLNTMALATTKTRLSVLFAGVVSLLGAILLLGVGFRAPSLYLLFDSFIVYAFMKRHKIPIGWLLFMGSFAILNVGLLGYFRLRGSWATSLYAIIRIAVWRIFLNNLQALNYVFNLFPVSEPYMWGRSYLVDASVVLPGYQPHFGFWLKDRLGLQFAGGGLTQTVVGELYLNWSWWGIIIGMFTLGILFRILYRALAKEQCLSTSKLALLVLLSTSLMPIVNSGVVLVLLINTIPLVAVFIAYRLCVRIGWPLPRGSRISNKPVSVRL